MSNLKVWSLNQNGFVTEERHVYILFLTQFHYQLVLLLENSQEFSWRDNTLGLVHYHVKAITHFAILFFCIPIVYVLT